MAKIIKLAAVLLFLTFNVPRSRSQTPETLKVMMKQIMFQQDDIEEQTRMSGGSGIKQVRVLNGGSKSYYYDSHTGQQMMAMHDHANYRDTIGLGEFAAVLNGVNFKTRHNDYMLVMPSKTKMDFDATDPIPLPEVPPEVKQKTTVTDQITEMAEWFKAFQKQDHSTRDYRKYFKPILCYLEGAWTNYTEQLVESFPSERHSLDSYSWDNLALKSTFDAYSGTKNRLENHAWLPRKIIDVAANMTPIVAQWNYRIRCAPINYTPDNGLSLKRFRVVNDLAVRMEYLRTLEDHAKSRGARFSLGLWDEKNRLGDMAYNTSLLDELMSQIPGYDNYPAELKDEAYDNLALDGKGAELNTGYYGRTYRALEPDAMGRQGRRRSFSDPNVFMAQNTRPNIPGMRYEECQKGDNGSPENCKSLRQKWSWAIPLEIVYLTPLLSWNPYDLEVRLQQEFRRTPSEFFEGPEIDPHPADTTGMEEQMFDNAGVIRKVRASGTRVIMPKIKGIDGNIRTRYPILPIYDEGNQVYKELESLKDIVMSLQKFDQMLLEEATVTCQNNCEQSISPPAAPAKNTNSASTLQLSFNLLVCLISIVNLAKYVLVKY